MAGAIENKIVIIFFTDPLCCWSWAFETQLRQLKSIQGNQITWQYCMGGLIPNWNNYYDAVNNVSRPVQMGPVWMHAGHLKGEPICHQLWMTDPPSTSYPACIAIKCAQLQSHGAGEQMLFILRDAAMKQGKNIAKNTELLKAAQQLSEVNPVFNLDQFSDDFFGNTGTDAFRKDLELVSYYRINRFPSLIIKTADAKTFLFSGYRHYEEILSLLPSTKITLA